MMGGMGGILPQPSARPLEAPAPTKKVLAALLLLMQPQRAAAFSMGGGNGYDEAGQPLVQWCDAISLCKPTPPDGRLVCPTGMSAVAPPERSSVYVFGTARPNVTSYQPGELLPFELRVTSRTILGKRNAGNKTMGEETAKYIGVLMYAVDSSEQKVGTWDIPLSVRAPQTTLRSRLTPCARAEC